MHQAICLNNPLTENSEDTVKLQVKTHASSYLQQYITGRSLTLDFEEKLSELHYMALLYENIRQQELSVSLDM
jgi:hypothetical protein